jgi:hypothetical protein
MLHQAIPMSIMRHAPVPTSSELQAEATAVERLRRQIAEMPSKGETVSPQMLADFARAQKAYLDRKIEFEKLKRTETSAVKLPSAVREAPAAQEPGVPVPAKFAAPLPKVVQPVPAENSPVAPQVAKVPVPPLPTAKPAKSPMIWVIVAVIAVILGIVALLVLR